ncbi:hypothetical protein [Bradyrhizobium erythrophlei]|uniref:Uncharacterized protein n=1 Tax=Bradyrhizobium erythrophlei TaxID=1437360 RepID=A0A1M5KN35_9BRAD|nr:hypothetical protein [Bradyrhizobium erythrophlei]SHG53909.1 hypothetical protein SAMN05444169_2947 [Bradyrhizobium erythrophlei]
MTDPIAYDDPCSTSILHRGTASKVVRRAMHGSWDHYLYYLGKTFLCHESDHGAGRTTPCIGFLEYKNAREGKRGLSNYSVRQLLTLLVAIAAKNLGRANADREIGSG